MMVTNNNDFINQFKIGSEVPNAIQITNQVYDATTQTTTADVIIIPGHWLLILAFTDTQRAGQASNNTGTQYMSIIITKILK